MIFFKLSLAPLFFRSSVSVVLPENLPKNVQGVPRNMTVARRFECRLRYLYSLMHFLST